MTIDWPAFTPTSALIGGLLIGTAAVIYLLGSGRIAGITGVLAAPATALVRRQPLGAQRLPLLFLLGLVLAPLAWRLVAPLPPATLQAGPLLLVLGGLAVGAGTRLANGCTSGHGVCGLARLSLRSLVNVGVFMAAGFATVYLVRHLWAQVWAGG